MQTALSYLRFGVLSVVCVVALSGSVEPGYAAEECQWLRHRCEIVADPLWLNYRVQAPPTPLFKPTPKPAAEPPPVVTHWTHQPGTDNPPVVFLQCRERETGRTVGLERCRWKDYPPVPPGYVTEPSYQDANGFFHNRPAPAYPVTKSRRDFEGFYDGHHLGQPGTLAEEESWPKVSWPSDPYEGRSALSGPEIGIIHPLPPGTNFITPVPGSDRLFYCTTDSAQQTICQ